MLTGRKVDRPRLAASRPAYQRIAVVGATTVAIVAVLTGSSLAAPMAPEPTIAPVTNEAGNAQARIAQVTAQVEALYQEMEVAAEASNDAGVRADEVRRRLTTLRANLTSLRRELTSAGAAAGAFAAAQYRGEGLDPVIQMMLQSDSQSGVLYRLAQLDHLADHQASTVQGLTEARAAVTTQEASIERETARLDHITDTLDAARATADAKHVAAQTLLDQLTAEEKARVAAELAAAIAAEAAAAAAAQAAAMAKLLAAPSDGAVVTPISPRAQLAIDYALLQLGDAYVWGAVGPNSYDCSGLTMMAWAAAGVSLPHSALMQSNLGLAVSIAELQPGDLVFYNTPVSHVAMYIGSGLIVQAANPLRPIGLAKVDSMPITGTRRMG